MNGHAAKLIKGAALDISSAPLISRLPLLPRFARLARYADHQRVRKSRSRPHNGLIASVACLGLLTAGCEPRGGNATGGTKVLKLAFVTNNSADFWTIARRGVEKADEELADVQAEFRITADGTAAEQQRVVDDLLTKGVDAIAISPVTHRTRPR
jgi:ABC-type sugar transport system substrate-binding protein